jgi:hypothetical protein
MAKGAHEAPAGEPCAEGDCGSCGWMPCRRGAREHELERVLEQLDDTRARIAAIAPSVPVASAQLRQAQAWIEQAIRNVWQELQVAPSSASICEASRR